MATSDEGPAPASTVEGSSGNPDRAVRRAYAAVRRVVDDRLGVPPDATHWEFHAAAAEAGLDGGALEALGRIVELYERATFSPASVSEADAEWAVGLASEFSERAGDR